MQHQGCSVRPITAQQLMSKQAFRAGVADVGARRPFQEMWTDDTDACWSYVRGRHFATATGLKYVKVKAGIVDGMQQRLFMLHWKRGDII